MVGPWKQRTSTSEIKAPMLLKLKKIWTSTEGWYQTHTKKDRWGDVKLQSGYRTRNWDRERSVAQDKDTRASERNIPMNKELRSSRYRHSQILCWKGYLSLRKTCSRTRILMQEDTYPRTIRTIDQEKWEWIHSVSKQCHIERWLKMREMPIRRSVSDKIDRQWQCLPWTNCELVYARVSFFSRANSVKRRPTERSHVC